MAEKQTYQFKTEIEQLLDLLAIQLKSNFFFACVRVKFL